MYLPDPRTQHQPNPNLRPKPQPSQAYVNVVLFAVSMPLASRAAGRLDDTKGSTHTPRGDSADTAGRLLGAYDDDP